LRASGKIRKRVVGIRIGNESNSGLDPLSGVDTRVAVVAEPPTVSAVELAELSYRLQPLRLTEGFPCRLAAPLALRLSESTHPSPSADA
jgi:hypothetical protein